MKLSQIVKIAYKEAEKAEEKGEVPVGAVIFNDKSIISKAHNLVICNKDPLAHAEILAIKKAVSKINKADLKGFKIYSTLEPCLFCYSAISMYFINSIYFGAYDNSREDQEFGKLLDNKRIIGSRPEIYGGIGEEKCSQIIKNFFKKIRKN